MNSSDRKPIVSIGLPVYNGERFLRKALDALLAQTYENFELILSDNASTDGTESICREYASMDSRIRYVRQSENIGMFDNFNFVFYRSVGDYFMWAGCDDYWDPKFIEILLNELERAPDAGVAYSALEIAIEKDNSIRRVSLIDDDPEKSSWLRILIEIALNKPFHNYIYGLYRSSYLKSVFTAVPVSPGPDQIFICLVALTSRLMYVDSTLHRRMKHESPLRMRYSNEAIGSMYQSRFLYLMIPINAIPYLLSNKSVPWRRKAFVPGICLIWLINTVVTVYLWYPIKIILKKLHGMK